MKYSIYCDMDGVLVDFNKGYFDLTGIDLKIDKPKSEKEFWKPIHQNELEFWTNLEWMPDGKQLWNHIKDHRPILLSAPSGNPESRMGKHRWVYRELPLTGLLLQSAKTKRKHAAPNRILIDDREDTIAGWIEDGGEGIVHTSAEETIKILKEKYKIFQKKF